MKPWETEPPGPHVFEAEGYRCVVRHSPAQNWNGYVGIPKEHPLYGLTYSAGVPGTNRQTLKDEPIGKRGIIPIFCYIGRDELAPVPVDVYFNVHGGITYAHDRAPREEPDGRWYFGFDTGHAGDLVPKFASEFAIWGDDATYRTLDYVKEETRNLARQLAAFHEKYRALAANNQKEGTP